MIRSLLLPFLICFVSCVQEPSGKSETETVEAVSFSSKVEPQITVPPSGQYISALNDSPTFLVRGTCDHIGKTIKVYIDNQVAVANGFLCDSQGFVGTINTVGWSQGNHSIKVSVLNDQGREVESNIINVVKDTGGPTVSIDTAPTITDSNLSNYGFSGSCSETGGTVNLNVGGLSTTATCNFGSWSVTGFDTTSLALGSNATITADLTDNAGNTATQALLVVSINVFDGIDDDNTLNGFGGGVPSGTSSSSGQLLLTATTNSSVLDSTWIDNFPDLLAYYQFDNNADDTSLNSNNGTVMNGVTFTTSSKIGGYAASFDGVDDYIDLGGFAPVKKSISLWVKFDTPGSFPVIYDGADDYSSSSWNFSVFVHLNLVSFRCESGGGGQVELDPVLNEWLFFVVVREDGGDCVVYQNGIEVGRDVGGAGSGNSTLRIGKADTTYFDGDLDDVGIWSSALTASQVLRIYRRQSVKYAGTFESRVMDRYGSSSWTRFEAKTPAPFMKELTGDVDGNSLPDSEGSAQYTDMGGTLSTGLVGLWNLNGNTQDSSGIGNNGTANGGVSGTTNGRLSSAYSFDGVDDYIDLGTGVLTNPGVTGFTVTSWIYPDNPNIYGRIYGQGTDTNNQILCSYGTGVFSVGVRSSPVWNSFASGIYPEREWYHVACVYDGSTASLYVNGKFEGSVAGTLTFTNGNAYIGTYIGAASPYFRGSIDEVAVWSRALSSSEILSVYRRGANRLKYQVRSCDDSLCSGESWQGPDGTNLSYFSEIQNRETAGLYSASGIVQTDSLSLLFSSFTAPASNRYFQYRVIMESDDENNLCSGSPCVPSIETITVTTP